MALNQPSHAEPTTLHPRSDLRHRMHDRPSRRLGYCSATVPRHHRILCSASQRKHSASVRTAHGARRTARSIGSGKKDCTRRLMLAILHCETRRTRRRSGLQRCCPALTFLSLGLASMQYFTADIACGKTRRPHEAQLHFAHPR